MNSLQRLFEDAEYFCLKLRILLSATFLTDWQLNNRIYSVIVSRDFIQNILLKQLPTAKSKELMCEVHYEISNEPNEPPRSTQSGRPHVGI